MGVSRAFIVLSIMLVALFSLPALATNLCTFPGENDSDDWTNKSIGYAAFKTGTSPELLSAERIPLTGDLAEYRFVVKVGPGQFDKIGIHRVTKENSAWHPGHTTAGVLMVHGDISTFDSAFLLSTIGNHSPAFNQSVGMFLAQNGYDVWGLDLRWTFVPDNTTSFVFMQNWTTKMHLSDITTAMKFAKAGRFFTGNHCEKLFVLGWSRGAQFAWSYANNETHRASDDQDLRALIPVETTYKYAPENEDLRLAACARYENNVLKRDLQGTYSSSTGKTVKGLPDPALLVIATQTYLASEPAPNHFYHFYAGIFNASGDPVDTKYTQFPFVKDFVAFIPPFQSVGEFIDGDAVRCGIATPYDDNLGAISVPIMNIAAAGGFGRTANYTSSLTNSTDKNETLIAFESPAAEDLDFGHADTMHADNAQSTWWVALKNWLSTR